MRIGKGVFVLLSTALLSLVFCPLAALAQDNLRLENSDPGTIMAVRVNPLETGTVYIATDQAGVLKTMDNGVTWFAKNAGLPTKSITDLAVDPVTPINLYITTISGAFRSTDGGETWIAMELGLEYPPVCTALALVPGIPGIVYLGTAVSGVFTSTDYGLTWVSLGGREVGRVTDLAAGLSEENQSQSISAGEGFKPHTVWESTPQGLYVQSGDDVGTTNWKKADPYGAYIYSTYFSFPNVFLGVHEGGLYRGFLSMANDGAIIWEKVPIPNENANINGLDLEPSPAPNQGPFSSASSEDAAEPALYAASWDGYVMKGVQEGEAWTWTNVLDAAILGVASVHPRVVSTVAVYGEDGALQTPVPLWVGTFSGSDEIGPHSGAVYYSSDGGAAWANTLAEGWRVAD